MHRDTSSPGCRLDLWVIVALWVPYALLVRRFWYVCDDAFISFRFARNLALGEGLRYNLGDYAPVEGYSNYLWVLISAVLHWIDADSTRWVPLLSTICGVVFVSYLYLVLRRRLGMSVVVAATSTAFVGWYPPVALWSTSGLATLPMTLLVLWFFDAAVLRGGRRRVAAIFFSGVFLMLIRAEGIGWVAVIGLLGLWTAWQRRESSKPLVAALAGIVACTAIYISWRYSYYGYWWPNSVYAKTNLPNIWMIRGLKYVGGYVLTFITPLILVPGSYFGIRRGAHGMAVVAMAWAFPVYSIVVTGDYMPMGRFLVPGVCFSAILLGWLMEDTLQPRRRGTALVLAAGALAVGVGLLPAWNLHIVPEGVRRELHFRHNTSRHRSEFEQWVSQNAHTRTWSKIGHALGREFGERSEGQPIPTYVAQAFGARGYYSNLTIFDQVGLLDVEVAHLEVTAKAPSMSPGHDRQVVPSYYLSRSPTLIDASIVSRAKLKQKIEAVEAPRGYVVDFFPLEDAKNRSVLLVTRRWEPMSKKERDDLLKKLTDLEASP